ncbi:hypothetical protein BGZ46_007251, partial [Entomortierella lignicola]
LFLFHSTTLRRLSLTPGLSTFTSQSFWLPLVTCLQLDLTTTPTGSLLVSSSNSMSAVTILTGICVSHMFSQLLLIQELLSWLLFHSPFSPLVMLVWLTGGVPVVICAHLRVNLTTHCHHFPQHLLL